MTTFTGNNTDTYEGHGKMWEIASRFNAESRKITFDRFGNALTKEVINALGHKEIVNLYTVPEMNKKQCAKGDNINVSRRNVSESEYKPVGVL